MIVRRHGRRGLARRRILIEFVCLRVCVVFESLCCRLSRLKKRTRALLYRFWEHRSSGPIIGAMKKSTHSPEYRILRTSLRDLRDAAGFSQRDLAERLKVPHSWVAKVESGERRIDLVELYWYAVACEAEPQSVLVKLLEQFGGRVPSRRAAGGRNK